MNYKATIKVLGQFYKAEGETVRDAISNLKVPMPRGVSILTLEKEDKKLEKIFGNLLTARLFSQSPMMRERGLKDASTLFEAF